MSYEDDTPREDEDLQNYGFSRGQGNSNGMLGLYQKFLSSQLTFLFAALVFGTLGCGLLITVLVLGLVKGTYNRKIVSAERRFDEPVITSYYYTQDSGKDNSLWRYHVDATLLRRRNESIDGENINDHDVLLIGARNLVAAPTDDWDTAPSQIVWAQVKSFSKIKGESSARPNFDVSKQFFFAPTGNTKSIEAPNVKFVPQLEKYFLFYTAVQEEAGKEVRRPAVRTLDKTHWVVGEYEPQHWSAETLVFPDKRLNDYFTDATLFYDGKNKTYLFYSDGQNILYTTPEDNHDTDLLQWKAPNPRNVLIRPRAEAHYEGFDSLSVRAGPSPVQLNNGNWLFIYNSFQKISGYDKENPRPFWDNMGNVGYVILDKDTPTDIVDRGTIALLTPELDWEKCDYTTHQGSQGSLSGYQPNTMAVASIKKVGNPDDDRFMVYYTACGSHVGVADIKIHSER